MLRNNILYLLCILAVAFSLFSGLREEYFIVKMICPLAIVMAGYIFYGSQNKKDSIDENIQKTTEYIIINGFGGALIVVTISSPETWKITLPLFLLLMALSVYWHKLDEKEKIKD